MNENQNKIIDLLRKNTSREIYEGAAQNGKDGTGLWYVTYTQHDAYMPLTTNEVTELEELGCIELRLPGCYQCAENLYEANKSTLHEELVFVGYTNGAQIFYASDIKEGGEGAFYKTTENDCRIPLYMLKTHCHRLESTTNGQVTLEKIREAQKQ